MLTLLLGRDWTANTDAIFEKIARDVAEQKQGRILIVPELISHDSERRLCKAAGDSASHYAEVLSFTRLGRRICDIVGFPQCLDNGGRLVAMAAAARSLSSRLKAYAALETRPEFLSELVDAVDEFKRCCITSEDLKAASQQTEGSLAQKLEELSLILESYDSLCARGKRDPRDQMPWVLEQLEELEFAKNHVIYMDGFPDLTRQHMAVLAHFIRESPQVVVSLNCDCVGSGLLTFEKAGATARELLEIARQADVPVQVQVIPERKSPLNPVKAGLFQGKAELLPELSGKLRLAQASSAYEECSFAAGEILKLVHAGCRYRDIALVCTDMAAYRPLLHLVFGKAGIPIYLSGTENVLQSGVMDTVLSALDAALGGFEQRQVLRYLRSSLSPLDADTCDLVENYAYIWKIDRKAWKEEWKFHPQGLNGQWDEESLAHLAGLNQARVRAIEPLEHLQEGFRKAVNLRQQILALAAFFEETALTDRIGQLSDAMESAGQDRTVQILDQLWEILLGAMEQLHDVLGETVWEGEHFSKLLKLLLSQYDVGTIPTVLDCVAVGPVTAMRCQTQKHLLLLGANEGSLPGYGGTTGLLSDQERVELRSLGLPLTGGAVEGLQAEFAEIYGVFCGAQETVTVSCTSQPSFVFKRLEAMVGPAEMIVPDGAGAITDARQAGAYLARWDQQETAQRLGVLDTYLDTLFKRGYALGTVELVNVKALYGGKLNLSASQIDRQAQCRLSYFLQYGLRARERKEATVDPAEFGTFVHAVLEQTVTDVMARGGFHQVDLSQTLELARKHADAYTQEHYSALGSTRLQYLFRRNVQELEMVVQELWRELQQAQYEPKKMELSFGFREQMAPIDIPGQAMQAQLRGLVDRVDTWQHGDATFFRVVDYKTGKKDFDYCDVYNGVGLQMLLYLFALEEAGDVIGLRRVPAGVQYFPARAPFISTDSDLSEEDAQKEHQKQWKRAGLLLSNEDSLKAMDPSEKLDTLCCTRKKDGTITGDLADRAQLGILKDYIYGQLGKMVDTIASGDVTADPYSRGTSFSSCTFCPYGPICHGGLEENRRNYKTMSAAEFWQHIGRED